PLAVQLGRQFPVVGFDINAARIEQLRQGIDRTREVDAEDLAGAANLTFTDDSAQIADCNTYIVTTPTPVDRHKRPDLSPVLSATRSVGAVLRAGDVVVYESTVYPGATEEECVPLLEELSGLAFNTDFFVGYSPERINPGDRVHRLTNIVKVTSGSTAEAADYVDQLYGSIVTVGTHQAASIRVAEAAKVIENTQRDVNIALMNELAILFERLGIDTLQVLEAAGTKWNFLNFRPGLVGGHCIGVDPYYLTHKAQEVGYHPEIIIAGRRLNDSMTGYVAARLVKQMTKQGIDVRGARALVLGVTFKEGTPDLRNSKVVDLVRELEEFEFEVEVVDPWADSAEALSEYGIEVRSTPSSPGSYAAVVVAVAHPEFAELGAAGIRAFGSPDGHVLYDLKGVLPLDDVDLRL
ncbi:MAG: nucleotide sugar dehydrogenase, partial [Candidatus Nanopelagicales bacterium]